MSIYYNGKELPINYMAREKEYIGVELGSIGYSSDDIPSLWKDGLEYAEEIKENWDSSITSMNSKYEGDTSLVFFPMIDTSKVTNMQKTFSGCEKLTTIPQLDTSKVTSMTGCFKGCTSLTTIPELDTSNVTSIGYCFQGCTSLTTIPKLNTSKLTDARDITYLCSGCSSLKRVEEISFKGIGKVYSSDFIFSSSNTSCSYLLIKDIGTKSACTTIDTTYARVWGINDEDNPDARQSLIDSLLTYSFDRATAGYSNCTIKLYSTVKALLTEEEINQIQAKGYIIS